VHVKAKTGGVMADFGSDQPPDEVNSFESANEGQGTPREASPERASRRTVAIVGLAIVALVGWGLTQAVLTAREAAKRASCSCHLMQLGLALHTYHDTYGAFPPAYTVDSAGRKMHSWRVFLLPYFGGSDAYAKYDMNESWDGPNNRLLWDQMPSGFHCPSDDSAPPNTTSYVAVVGPSTMWPGTKAGKIASITDGSSATIAVVEAKNLAIPWLEPSDLDETTMSAIINDPATKNSLSSCHPQGVMVLMADGSAKFLKSDTDPVLLKSLLTRAGGESVSLPWRYLRKSLLGMQAGFINSFHQKPTTGAWR